MNVTRTPTRRESNGPFVVRIFDDFHRFSGSATTGVADYEVFETAAGATQLLSAVDSGGVLILTQAANDDDVIAISGNAGVKLADCKPGEPLFFQARVMTEDADDVDLHIGLSIKDNSMQAGAPADYVCFRLQEGGAGLDLVISKDSVTTIVDNLITIADSTWFEVEFTYLPDPVTPDIGSLLYTVRTNGFKASGSVNAAGNFPDDVVIFPMYQVQNGTTAADVSKIDYWELQYTLPALADNLG